MLMTAAPQCLKDVRALLLDHLDIHENTNAYPTDLDPNEVGIVGDSNHYGGAHCGSNRVKRDGRGRITDYTVVESERDRAFLTLDAAGLDVGYFKVTTRKGTFDLHHYSRWLVAQCIANTPDTRDLREIIYSPDGRVVRRWDRLGRRSSGDDSHLFHTHKTYFRDAIKAGRDQRPVVRRYLTEIGLLAAETEDDMPYSESELEAMPWRYDGRGMPGVPAGKSTLWVLGSTYKASTETLLKVDALAGVVEAMAEVIRSGGGSVDTAAILAGVDQRVTAAVSRIEASTRDAVADLGEGGASQVRADQTPAP